MKIFSAADAQLPAHLPSLAACSYHRFAASWHSGPNDAISLTEAQLQANVCGGGGAAGRKGLFGGSDSRW